MKYKKVAVGGTFDNFHKGHEELLIKAFEIGNEVLIGVTSDRFGGMKGNIEPCSARMSNLENFLAKFHQKYDLVRLDEPYGPTIFDEEIETIVVSEETKSTADRINEIRKRKDMTPLDILEIHMVLAEDGEPISSTRIRKGEIDRNGKTF